MKQKQAAEKHRKHFDRDPWPPERADQFGQRRNRFPHRGSVGDGRFVEEMGEIRVEVYVDDVVDRRGVVRVWGDGGKES